MDILLTFHNPINPPPPLQKVWVIFEYADGTRDFIEAEFSLNRWRTIQYNMSSGYQELMELEKGEKILGWCDSLDLILKNLNLNFD